MRGAPTSPLRLIERKFCLQRGSGREKFDSCCVECRKIDFILSRNALLFGERLISAPSRAFKIDSIMACLDSWQMKFELTDLSRGRGNFLNFCLRGFVNTVDFEGTPGWKWKGNSLKCSRDKSILQKTYGNNNLVLAIDIIFNMEQKFQLLL